MYRIYHIYIHIDFSSARKEAKLNCILALCVFVYTLLYGSTSLSLATIILCVYAHELRYFRMEFTPAVKHTFASILKYPIEPNKNQNRNVTTQKKQRQLEKKNTRPNQTELNAKYEKEKNIVLCVFPTLSVRKCDLMCFETKAQQEF